MRAFARKALHRETPAEAKYSLSRRVCLQSSALRGFGAVLVRNGRWVEAEQKLKETPALLKLPSGYFQQNPWLTIANKQLELMHKFLSELGLSPVSRSRVSVVSNKPKPWEFGQSKFVGLLGKAEPDEFFGD